MFPYSVYVEATSAAWDVLIIIFTETITLLIKYEFYVK